MMNTEEKILFDENDIEILDEGISIKGTFFNKRKIADTFNELTILHNHVK